MTKKFEDMGSRIGSFTLDCETKDFPSFTVRLDGVTWGTFTLNFSNFLNVVEGTIYLDIISTSTLNLPATSYESGSVITSKTFSIGTYKVTFSYLYGEYFFDFALASGGGTWGSITGTLSSQTDLQSALDNKVTKNSAITGATKTKVTYDSKGLVTSGADATTADIADSTNKRYQTDNQQTFNDATSSIQNQLNTKAATTYVDIQDKKFKIDIEYQSGALLSKIYFETTATLTLVRKESTISTLEYSTNGGGSYSSITAGVISIAIPALTYVIFRITYVTPSADARGNVYLEGTY